MTDKEIYEQCKIREEAGLCKYGEFNPETDSRDMITEITEELLDVINYAKFQIKKLTILRGQIEEITKRVDTKINTKCINERCW